MPLGNPTVPVSEIVTRIKLVDQTINDDDVMQNDNDLIIPVEANEVCEIQLILKMNLLAASDIRYQFDVPAGATMLLFKSYIYDDGLQDFDATTPIYVLTSGLNYLWVKAIYYGGANAGNIQFQWAQRVSTAEDTTVNKDSTMRKIILS